MGRSPCCDKSGLKKGPWTPEEDLKLIQYIQAHGPGNWRTLPKNAGLQRCGKSCRLRWTNYLRPDIKRGRFSFEEEETIIQLHSILGNKWSAIAARLPGRTDNEIKNYWNTHIRKRLLRMRIDPVTHSPRLDLLDLSSLLGSTQLHLSNLLGLQALVNPEVLRLAASTLFASQQNDSNSNCNNINPEMLLQKLQESQLLMNTNNINGSTNQFQLQHHQIPPPCTTTAATATATATITSSDVPLQPYGTMNLETCGLGNYGGYFGSSGEQSLSNSVLSTPLNSSPTTLVNSGSTSNYNNSVEDEKERFCSNLMRFEIPASLDCFEDLL